MLPLADECYNKSRQMSHNKNKIYASSVQHKNKIHSHFLSLHTVCLSSCYLYIFLKLLRSDSRLDLSFLRTSYADSLLLTPHSFSSWNNEYDDEKKELKQSKKKCMNWDRVLVTYKVLCRTEIQYHVKQKTARK